MPVTRSQKGRVFEDPPASPSTAAVIGGSNIAPRPTNEGDGVQLPAFGGVRRSPPPTTAPQCSATEYSRDAAAARALAEDGGLLPPPPPPQRTRSEQGARVEEPNQQSAPEGAAQARSTCGCNRKSGSSVIQSMNRVDEWLRRSETHLQHAEHSPGRGEHPRQGGGERPPSCREYSPPRREEHRWGGRTPSRWEQRSPPRWEEFPPPGRGRRSPSRRRDYSPPRRGEATTSGGIEQLAEALRACMAQRPPARQAMELPTFSGAPGEWLPFKAAMEQSTKLYRIGPAENLARLRVCLRGDARTAVEALLHTAVDPELIMSTLNRCYGHPSVIANQCLANIKKLPRVGSTAEELNSFAVKVQNVVHVLTSIGKKSYLFNPSVPAEIVEKLSPHLRSRWADYAAERYEDDDDVPEVELLTRFLNREAERALRFTYAAGTTAPTTTRAAKPAAATARGRGAKQAVFATTVTQPVLKKTMCVLCDNNDDHVLSECKKYRAMDIAQRWSTVRSHGLCFKCVSGKHRRRACEAKLCGMNDCRRPHHPSLHEEAAPPAPFAPKKDEETVLSCATTTEPGTILLKVCPVIVSGPRGSIRTYALLDEGSTVSLIDAGLADSIGAEGPARPLHIQGVCTGQEERDSRCVKLTVRGEGENEEHELRARTIRGLELRGQSAPPSLLRYPHMSDLGGQLIAYSDQRPYILIGADQWPLIVTRELRVGRPTEPAASRTRLGWVAHGTAPRVISQDRESVLHIHSPQTNDGMLSGGERALHELVEAHFGIDSLGVTARQRVLSADDARAVDIFNRTYKKTEKGYEVGLPWKSDDVVLPPSYAMALNRLRSIERQMGKSPAFAEAYTAQMTNMFEKGYATPCEGNEEESPRCWYLPHFAVRNPNKPKKTRLVFDARAESRGVSLNSQLLEGPDLLLSLQGILFRFRERPVAVTSDIAEMFLRVKIRSEDQPAQLFLWRGGNQSQPPQTYKMTSMIFGATSSPFLAHSVRDVNARAHADTHPRALAAITTSHYMDDYVDSYTDIDEARRTVEEVRAVHSEAGFTLRGWSSNDEGALRDVPAELRAETPRRLCEGAGPEMKILGLYWDAATDTLAFNVSMHRVPAAVRARERAPTKREALSAVMSIYDPLGLLSHYTIRAKIVLQRLWQRALAWDEAIPKQEADDLGEWLHELRRVDTLRVPRLYGLAEDGETELHVLCDASEQAFAAAAYWRSAGGNYGDEVAVTLVAAKARVAPRRTQTIPRLELQAAVIGARLADTIRREHRVRPTRTVFWTDSATVKNWIDNPGRKYTPFVEHRLTEIIELTQGSQWRWLPSAENVADDATRLQHAPVTADSRWYRRPAFLYHDEQHWPVARAGDDPCDEGEVVLTCSAREGARGDHLPDVTRFSTYERLIGATARVFAFADMCRGRAARVTCAHMDRAERALMERAQRDSFADEWERLRCGRALPRSSRLRRLDPVLSGDDGLMRVRGRVNAALVPAHTKRPVILDGRLPFTRLLVARAHRAALHSNNERVVNDLRQRYHILRLRPTVRAVARDCALCRVRRALPAVPAKGDLPAGRLAPYHRAFTHCGVDYFGPLQVKIGRRREKRWVALFTCLTTRAVHLELVGSLSTDSALMALRRMAARRGWPATIWSDNATNFRGADRELRAAYEEWGPALYQEALLHRAQWRFIPPGAPNMGGAWERMVRSVKAALSATLRERAPPEEVLHTLLIEAEHAVNSRPLTHVPVDPSDPEALTPNHFLLGSSSGLPTTGACSPADRRAWRATQALADAFWRRWVEEYLPTLVARGEPSDDRDSLHVGDIVIIADGALPRNVWPRGEVTQVFPGSDGGIRTVEVRTRGGKFLRPARRCVVLLRAEERAAQATPGGGTVEDGTAPPR